ncbi:ABC transporter permease subunit [Devosia sp. FKR38]|uniref:ABC transporter permease n=1 Tax=Devosia sp. FKR38 TaxID=2562312 RepID=UPI0010BFA2C2|nr:ABC transporter permease subunit [Devosia sp. FKR38]
MARSKSLPTAARFYLVLMGLFLVGPFVPLVIQSFAFQWDWPNLLPSEWWFTARDRARLPLGWDYVLSPYSRLGEAVVNTVVIGGATTLICLAICLSAARVLAREQFAGKRAVEFYLSLPLIVPEAAVGLALSVIFVRVGLAGSYAGIIIAHLIPTIPYMVRLLTAVYQGLDPGFEEQARVLGANRLQALRLVTMPMLLPGILAGCLFTFLVSTNLFLLTFLLGQGKIITVPTLLFAKIAGGSLDASAAGIALVATLPGIALLLVSERLLDGRIGMVAR